MDHPDRREALAHIGRGLTASDVPLDARRRASEGRRAASSRAAGRRPARAVQGTAGSARLGAAAHVAAHFGQPDLASLKPVEATGQAHGELLDLPADLLDLLSEHPNQQVGDAQDEYDGADQDDDDLRESHRRTPMCARVTVSVMAFLPRTLRAG